MSSHCRSRLRALALAGLAVGVAGGCKREERRFRDAPPPAPESAVRQSQLQPGPPTRQVTMENPAESRAYDVSEGKRLYQQFNCVGCHFQGGGGIGPPLMDDTWIYG